MTFHNESAETALSLLKSDKSTGLTDEKVRELKNRYGKNKLSEKRKKSNLKRFFAQFKDVMIIILLIAAAISFFVAWAEGNTGEFFEPVLILLIVVLNTVMGVLQESKAEKALEALKSLSAPGARVLRNGTESIVDAEELVPGDIIHLEAGDFVPADARLLQSASLKAEESALTGESVASEKFADTVVAVDSPLGDRNNMVFSGCSITYGTATAVVTGTGMNTEIGKIADMLNNEDEVRTPLQAKLAQLGKYLGFLAIGACAIIFVIGLINGIPATEIFMTSVSLAVSAIPEGLPAIVTVILSIGVQRMVNKNAIIRRLPAVETLGSASVICSDKTGTLTQNRMTLTKIYADGEEISFPDTISSDAVLKTLKYAALCCDGSVIFDGENAEHIGDPTETAIIYAAHLRGMSKDELNEKNPRLAEIPFDSDRKLMSTVNRIDGKNTVIVKGAFDVLADRCISCDTETARSITEEMSADALRVLAVAYKEIDSVPEALIPDELESDLIFMGLVGMIDPPRPEAKKAVEVCRSAGIKPVMITGDHITTASAIAKELGILSEKDRSITGLELDAMSEDELNSAVESISVYARVSPENKIRIVKAWQCKGHVVAMTGDGVNDAPALKAADIGCVMGITGTDVAKGAADITLTDDNFATIVDAVREGRGIYSNIKKVVGFLLGTNIGEVVVVFIAMLLWHKVPLQSAQLLWINLVTDSLPAIALGMEPIETDIMDKKPKPKDESLFANGFGTHIILQGLMFGILSLLAFRIGENVTGLLAGGQTLAFTVLALSQILQAFNLRSNHSIFKIGPFTNTTLNRAALISTLLVAVVIFTPLSEIFGLISLPPGLYGIGLILTLVPLLVMEISKKLGWLKHSS